MKKAIYIIIDRIRLTGVITPVFTSAVLSRLSKIKPYLFIAAFIFLSGVTHAAPYKCGANDAVFADMAQCDLSCGGLKCEEMDPGSTYSGECDLKSYTAFAEINGRTFALTKSPVTWGSVNAAVIYDAVENDLVKNMLISAGITEAWIGFHDPAYSTDYGNVDKKRFRAGSGESLRYDNFRSGEPDNKLDPASVGISSVYGEHWATISSDGLWQDRGYNGDGTERVLPAAVEFNGSLSCVSVKPKTATGTGLTGMMCAGDPDSSGMVNLFPCQSGPVFGSGITGHVCPQSMAACVESRVKKTKVVDYKHDVTLSGIVPGFSYALSMSFKNIDGNLQVYALYDAYWNHEEYNYPVNGKLISSGLLVHYGGVSAPLGLETGVVIDPDVVWSEVAFTLEYSVEEEYWDAIRTCPYAGRPCVDTGSGYYCSPADCLDSSDSGNFVPGEATEEGSNDPDNNGRVDADGNCMGNLRIFPGQDKRCRTVGIQTAGVQCCKKTAIQDADKPDISLSKKDTAAILWATGISWLILLARDIDFKVCNGSERQLAVNRGFDQCVYVGDYCSEKWAVGGCVQKKSTYCCYDSDFSRAFNEAGMSLLGRWFGTPESPDCGGFTPEELQKISAMGISDHPSLRTFADKLGGDFSVKMDAETNSSMNALTPQIKNRVKEGIEGLK